MKRTLVLLTLVVLLVVLAVPSLARADADPAVASSEPTLGATTEGFTWDESVSSAGAEPEGWTWDESASTQSS
jgi:hypothetical protein